MNVFIRECAISIISEYYKMVVPGSILCPEEVLASELASSTFQKYHVTNSCTRTQYQTWHGVGQKVAQFIFSNAGVASTVQK